MNEYELEVRVPSGRRNGVADLAEGGAAQPVRLRARYFDTLDGHLAAHRYLKRLRPAQDALGAWHDDVLALDVYEATAARNPRAWYAVGWLTAQQPAHAATCHRALRRLKRAAPFWGKA